MTGRNHSQRIIESLTIMRGLAGRRIIVASGATGIGAAIAKRLAAEGARLIVGDINEEGLAKTVAEIEESDGEVHGVPFDLEDGASITRLVQACADRLGGVDGLANVGAFIRGAQAEGNGDLLDMDVGLWERAFRINVVGHALTIKAAIPHMFKGGGAIVGISSGAAYLGLPTLPAYSTTKMALHALTRHVAKRWGSNNIRCNLVVPGWIMTDTAKAVLDPDIEREIAKEIPLPRFGRPEDIAATVAFLMSQDGEWITGQAFSVNGGQVFRD